MAADEATDNTRVENVASKVFSKGVSFVGYLSDYCAYENRGWI